MTTGTVTKRQLISGVLILLAAFLGLCTIFVLVVTAGQAWVEHAQAQWPTATASVDKCEMRQSSSGRRNQFYVRCRVIYEAGGEPSAATIYSKSAPGREVWQYPPNQIAPLEDWLEEHPRGTPIVVHYNPANHTKIAVVESDMLVGGPRTANNVKLLKLVGGGFFVLLTIGLITRPRANAMDALS